MYNKVNKLSGSKNKKKKIRMVTYKQNPLCYPVVQ